MQSSTSSIPFVNTPSPESLRANTYSSLFGDGATIDINQLKGMISNDWVKPQYDCLSQLEKNIVEFFILNNGVSEIETLFEEDTLIFLQLPNMDLNEAIYSLIKRDLIHIRGGNKNYYELNYYLSDYVIELLTREMTGTTTVQNTGFFASNSPQEDFSKLGDDQSSKTFEGTRRKIEQIIKDEITILEKLNRISDLRR